MIHLNNSIYCWASLPGHAFITYPTFTINRILRTQTGQLCCLCQFFTFKIVKNMVFSFRTRNAISNDHAAKMKNQSEGFNQHSNPTCTSCSAPNRLALQDSILPHQLPRSRSLWDWSYWWPMSPTELLHSEDIQVRCKWNWNVKPSVFLPAWWK